MRSAPWRHRPPTSVFRAISLKTSIHQTLFNDIQRNQGARVSDPLSNPIVNPCRCIQFFRSLAKHVLANLRSRNERKDKNSHLLPPAGESPVVKSCMSSLTSSISSIRLSISKERERAGSWMAPWRAQARYFSASFSHVSGFFG
jgi:hypothetical protein